MNQQAEEFPSFSQDTTAQTQAVLQEKLIDAQTPGAEIEFDPHEAATAGAFTEDALSEEEAKDSHLDVLEAMEKQGL